MVEIQQIIANLFMTDDRASSVGNWHDSPLWLNDRSSSPRGGSTATMKEASDNYQC